MAWQVEVSDEFIEWYDSLDEHEGVSVDSAVDMLEEYGPSLSEGLMSIRSTGPDTQI